MVKKAFFDIEDLVIEDLAEKSSFRSSLSLIYGELPTSEELIDLRKELYIIL